MLTLQLNERDEKISQAGSETKIQSKISKAKTIVMKQLKSAFKRKEGKLNLNYKGVYYISLVLSSADNDDPLLSSIKHSSGIQ